MGLPYSKFNNNNNNKTFSPRDPLSYACMTCMLPIVVQYKFSVESSISSVVIIVRFCVKF